jgi:hypothetical protein
MKTCDTFSILARYYNEINRSFIEIRARELIEIAWGHSCRCLCDYASVTGFYLKTCIDAGFIMYGCDISPSMIQRARIALGKRSPVWLLEKIDKMAENQTQPTPGARRTTTQYDNPFLKSCTKFLRRLVSANLP